MGFDFTLNGNHLDSVTSPVIGPAFTFGGMFKTTKAQGRRLITIYNRSSSAADFVALLLDTSAAVTGKFGVYINATGAANPQQALAGAVDGTWMGADVCVESTNSRSVMSAGGNKATGTGVYSPAGLNGVSISGRPSDHTFGIGGGDAHNYIYNRKLEDVERRYLQLGGARRAIKSLLVYVKCNRQSAGTVPDELGNCNFAITGTMAATADNPAMASYYTGSAIGAQVYTVGTPIASLTVGTSMDAVDSTLTYALMKVGASTASTTAAAPIATATRVVPVADVTIFAPGDYASVGAGGPSRVYETLVGTSPAGAIVLADDQSFSTGAAVARYPAATAAAIPGITLNSTTGVLSGNPTNSATLAANYFIAAVNSAAQTNARLRADTNLFPITVNALPVAPTFSIFPTAVARADGTGYDSPFLPNTACTIYAGAYAPQVGGGTDPTISQLKAGTGARKAVSKAVTGVDSVSLTGIDFPLSDLFFVLNNNLGDSSLYVLRSQLKGPPVGSVYRVFSAPIDPDTIYLGQVSTGDVEEASSTLSPSGVPVDYAADGNDDWIGVATRQKRVGRIYDVSTNQWMLDSSGAQQFNVWYNDVPPVFVGGPSVLIIVALGVPMAPFALTPLFQSTDGTLQKVTALDALPGGMSIDASSRIVGTPTVGGIFIGKRIRSTDLAGGTGDGKISIIAGPIHPPNLFSLDYRDASAQILAAFLVPDIVFQDDDGPPNIVLSQDPPSTASVLPNSKVTINVSHTPPGQIPTYGLRDHAFTVVPQADGDLDLNHPDGSG